MARVDAPSPSAVIDWNGDGVLNATFGQDVNFDGATPGTTLTGFNDWSNIRLDQIGAQGLWPDGGSLEFDGGLLGRAGGLLGRAGGLLGRAGGLLGRSGGQGLWPDGGGLDGVEGGLLGRSGGLLGRSGGLLGRAGGLLGRAGGQELSFDHATAMGKRPSAVTACVIGKDAGCATAAAFTAAYHRIEVRFEPSPIGSFSSHEVQRKRASESDAAFKTVGTTTTTVFTEATELPNNVAFSYRVRGLSSEGNSGWSHRSAAITAVNDAPIAVADSYTGPAPALIVAAPGVLANDRDGDSPTAFLGRRAVRVAGPSSGTLVLNSNCSFTYTPNICGRADSFTYTADDGPWSEDSTVA